MKSRYILLFFMMLHLCAFVHGQKGTNKICDYETLFKEAQNRVKKSDYDTALLVFNSARRCDPSKAEVIDDEIAKVLKAINDQNTKLIKEKEKNKNLTQTLKDSVDLLVKQRKELVESKDFLIVTKDELEISKKRLEKANADLQNSYDSLNVSQQLNQVDGLLMIGMESIKKQEYSSALSQFEDAKIILGAINKPLPVLSVKRNLIDTLIVSTQKELDKKIKFSVLMKQIDQTIPSVENITLDFSKAYTLCIEASKTEYNIEEVKKKVLVIDSLWLISSVRKIYKKQDRLNQLKALALSVDANFSTNNPPSIVKIFQLINFDSELTNTMVQNIAAKAAIQKSQEGIYNWFKGAGFSFGFHQFLPIRFGNQSFLEIGIEDQKYTLNTFPVIPQHYIEFFYPISKRIELRVALLPQISNSNRYKIEDLGGQSNFFSAPQLSYTPKGYFTLGFVSPGISYQIFSFKDKQLKTEKSSLKLIAGISSWRTKYDYNSLDFDIKIKNIADRSFEYQSIKKNLLDNQLGTSISKDLLLGRLLLNPSTFPVGNDSYDLVYLPPGDIYNRFTSVAAISTGLRFERRIITVPKFFLFGAVDTHFFIYNRNKKAINVQEQLSNGVIEKIFFDNRLVAPIELIEKFERFNKINNDILIKFDPNKWSLTNLSLKLGISFKL